MSLRREKFAAAFLVVVCVVYSCARARFTTFRGEKLDTSISTLKAGEGIAQKYCSSCHLTPLPESMAQRTANYMLAYMGLFLGIDAGRQLDPLEKEQFKQRYALLKSAAQIPNSPALSADEWKALRAYYLGLARYPFESSEKSKELGTKSVALDDQGVTMVVRLEDGRVAVGGGVKGGLHFYDTSLKKIKSVKLDFPPVYLMESKDGYYVLTLGSLLGALGEENNSTIYFIDKKINFVKAVIRNLPRSAHFFMAEINGDKKPDFFVAAFGGIMGGGLFLVESTPSGYVKSNFKKNASLVRVVKLKEDQGRVEFLALAGGAAEALLHFVYEKGRLSEHELVRYPPHLGSVWMEYADADGDGNPEILVLSGDNADAGPYQEAKGDQGLRVYDFGGVHVKQKKFISLPGALSMALIPRKEGGNALAVARFYASPVEKHDLSVVNFRGGKFLVEHFTLPSRPTVLAPVGAANGAMTLLVGSGNFPQIAYGDGAPITRNFTGPALFTLEVQD